MIRRKLGAKDRMVTHSPHESVSVKIREQGIDTLSEYNRVPIAFEVTSRLRVDPLDGGLGGFSLVEEKVEPSFIKDYDVDEDEGPERWATQWDIRNWMILAAFDGTKRVAGAAVAWNTSGVNMLEGRDDLAVLWDLRVHPVYRRCGIGSQLFAWAEEWAGAKGCRRLKVETQNINVRACRFYASRGCELGAIHRFAYDEYPDEAMLLWYKTL